MDKLVALITGSGKRLGREIALSLSKIGYNIVINYLNSEKEAYHTVDLIKKMGSDSIAVKADIRNKNEIKKLFDEVIKKFKRLDILVNNAAVFEKKEFNKINEQFWENTINTNLKSVFFCSQLAAKQMKKQKFGQIINISSLGGIKPYKDYLPYSVSKAGVVMLTKCLAKELAPEILVNCIAPGIIQFDDKLKKEKRLLKEDKILLKKFGKADDVSSMITFLALNNKYITGQLFIIDGGRILN